MTLAMKLRPVPHVLVVDDDRELSQEIANYLDAQGFQVSVARDGAEMDSILERGLIDIIVLDLMLPGEDGLSICQRLKGDDHPPVLMLSAIGDDIDRIVGLELGADDYLAKPCVPRELLARLKAILRYRRRQTSPSPSLARSQVYVFCGFRFDILAHELTAPSGVSVLLTSGEFSLLRAFVQRPRCVLTRDELLDAARGEDSDVFDRVIDVQLSRLRRKLASFTDQELVKTYRRAGYMFTEAVVRL
jgi:two-component system OmpR family response regulator